MNLELLTDSHLCKASKDRTGLFANKPEFIINHETGKMLLDWSSSSEPKIVKPIEEQIEECLTVKQLLNLHKSNPQAHDTHRDLFVRKKYQLEKLVQPKNFNSNGVHKN